MKEKIQYFPITAFAVIMGLTGLSIVLGKFTHMQWLPEGLWMGALLFVSALFVLISIMYGLKAMLFSHEAKADFRHPIRINFFSAISISFLLLSIAYQAAEYEVAMYLWWIGTLLHTFFMLKTISFWIQHHFEIQHFNPAWFIPVVGNIIIPVAGVAYVHPLFNYFYFSVGFFFWLVLFVIFLNRVVFHGQLAEKFIPTFFILLAPPAVGFISYMRITGSWDSFSMFLLMMTYFFIALLAFMYKSFFRLRFFMSWWAFTFPLTAATLASALAWQTTELIFFKVAAWVLFGAALVAIGIVSWFTIHRIRKGQICVKED